MFCESKSSFWRCCESDTTQSYATSSSETLWEAPEMSPYLAKKSMEEITRLSNLDRERYVAMGEKLRYDPMKVTPSVWAWYRRHLIRVMKAKTKTKTKTKTGPLRSHKACTICKRLLKETFIFWNPSLSCPCFAVIHPIVSAKKVITAYTRWMKISFHKFDFCMHLDAQASSFQLLVSKYAW